MSKMQRYKNQLSVVMANYNHAQYLRESIESVLSQSYQPMEFIIIDDGSTDQSVEVIESYAKKYSIIRFFEHEKNEGVHVTVNQLLELAQGEYIYFQSADDKVHPGFFEKSMRCLLSHPQAVLCTSDPAYFNDSGPLKSRAFRLSRQPTYLSPKVMVDVIRRENFFVGGLTTIARIEAIKEAGGWIEDLKWHCDWFALHVMAFRYGSCYIPEFLASMRESEKSYSRNGTCDSKEQRQVIENILNLLMQDRYRDVRDQFVDSGILSVFGAKTLRVVFNDSRFSRFRTFRFVWNTFKREMKGIVGKMTPKIIKTTYRMWRDSQRPFVLTRKWYGH